MNSRGRHVAFSKTMGAGNTIVLTSGCHFLSSKDVHSGYKVNIMVEVYSRKCYLWTIVRTFGDWFHDHLVELDPGLRSILGI